MVSTPSLCCHSSWIWKLLHLPLLMIVSLFISSISPGFMVFTGQYIILVTEKPIWVTQNENGEQTFWSPASFSVPTHWVWGYSKEKTLNTKYQVKKLTQLAWDAGLPVPVPGYLFFVLLAVLLSLETSFCDLTGVQVSLL